MEVRHLAVIGTGLIGASVALAAKRSGSTEVVGYDPEPRALDAAVERGAVDRSAHSLDEAVAEAELAVVAAPVAQLAGQVRAALEASPETCTVTDVGSTKVAVSSAALGSGRFVGGHPVCGSEARGAEHASGELFDGATWFLTPLAATEPDRYRLVHGFVASLGATPVAVDPVAHDRLEQALAERDAGFLAKWIGEAAVNRQRMLAEAYPDPGALQQLRVHVPDRPGVLAGITQALGAERINIEDFELLHMSPDRGGTLTVLVSGEDEARRAAALLEAQGYGVVVTPVLSEQ